MSDANKTIVRQFYEGISAGNLSVFDTVVAADFVEHWGVTDTGTMMQQLQG